jgi:hypothetical protein
MAHKEPVGHQGRSMAEGSAGARLQILATEHWSLLATRSLTYSEGFSRVGMFFTVLTGAVIALALLAQAEHFNQAFVSVALLILSVVFIIGLATLGRLSALNREDVLWVAAMNRLRHAYLEMDPDLAPYFYTDTHDDIKGTLATMGLAPPGRRIVSDLAHGSTTLPAMLAVIVEVVAGVLGALTAAELGTGEGVAILVGAGTFLVMATLVGVLMQRSFMAFASGLQARFPSNGGC